MKGASVQTGSRMSENLERFLKDRGFSTADVTAQVEDVYGPPFLTVASGSVVHGFGNTSSDVDIMVLVDSDRVTDLPLTAYSNGQAFDVAYLHAPRVRATIDDLITGELLAGLHDRDTWREVRRRLWVFTRVPLGVAVDGVPDWLSWHADLDRPAIATGLRDWWRNEALRIWCAARLLREAKPYLAVQRYCDAGLAALNARAAAAGESFCAPKWLPQKLNRTGDADGVRWLRQLFALPTSAADEPAYLRRAEEMLGTLLPLAPDSAQLRLRAAALPGVRTVRIDGRTVVTRWFMRGVRCDQQLTEDIREDQQIWEGTLAELPPWLGDLARANMIWLGVLDWRNGVH